MNTFTTKTDRFNELMGKEIESKIKILSKQSIDDTATYIFNQLKNNKGRFLIAPSLDGVKPSKTLTRHYAYVDQEGKIRKAFTITQRERDGLLQIKRKGPETIYYENVLCKTETIEPLAWKIWSNEAEKEIKRQEARVLGINSYDADKIFVVLGVVERKKLKIRVINTQNNRTYTVGIDKTTAPNGKFMQQIEVEYIGIESYEYSPEDSSFNSQKNNLEKEIADEIKHIEQQVIDICYKGNIKLKVTKKTKFKWLRKMHISKIIKQSQDDKLSSKAINSFRVFF